MDKFDEMADEYVKRPYTRILTPDGDGFTGEVLEFPGCVTHGDNPEEAYGLLDDALSLYVATLLEDNKAVPEPISSEQNGNIAVRTSSDLHRQAIMRSKREGISLNQWMQLAMEERLFSEKFSDLDLSNVNAQVIED